MSLVLVVPMAEAAAFTAGCALIHALRRHADGVTLTLTCVVALLILVLGIAAMPENLLTQQALGITEEGAAAQAVD